MSYESLFAQIVDRLNVGVFVVNQDLEILVWNRFMASGTGRSADQVLGKKLLEVMPGLASAALIRKIRTVFRLGGFAFSSWEQRPYILPTPPRRPITGGAEHMQQDCTFVPLKGQGGSVEAVCVTIVDVTETAIYRRKLVDALASDELTGVFNRRHVLAQLEVERHRADRYASPLSVGMLDVDHFKRINDRWGHLAGDEALRHVSAVIRSAIRPTDVVGRYGGEEFLLVFPSTNGVGAGAAAERLRLKIAAEHCRIGQEAIPITVSIGVAQYRANESVTTMIGNADQAMYASKSNGRDRVTVHAASASDVDSA